MNLMQDKRKLALALVVMFSTYSTLLLPLQGEYMKQGGRLCKVGGGEGGWVLVPRPRIPEYAWQRKS